MLLRFLHLSDIHFRKVKAGKEHLDLDKNLQREVENDLQKFCKANGSINAILIGGDIAFSGKKEEYDLADEWLKKISGLVSCEVENILVVPGNHDVDRNEVGAGLSAIRTTYRNGKVRKTVDPLLHKLLASDSDLTFLLKPFENYYNFAAKYGSVPSIENKVFWEKNFKLGSYVIRVRGVNSALISDEGDDEGANKLYLGSVQTNIVRDENTIDVFMCHHPPSWLSDQDDVIKDLKHKTHIQLYGHKHKANLDKVNECLILSAGAMQPSRGDDDWEPCFNIVDLRVSETTNEITLKVSVWRRVYDHSDTQRFIPKVSNGKEFQEYDLIIEKKAKSSARAKPLKQTGKNKTVKKISKKKMNVAKASVSPELINVNTSNPTRKLSFLFLSLSYHDRLEIAVQLRLHEETDVKLSDMQKAQHYFDRAKERKILKQLWDLTVQRLPDQNSITNPFNS